MVIISAFFRSFDDKSYPGKRREFASGRTASDHIFSGNFRKFINLLRILEKKSQESGSFPGPKKTF